MIVVGRCCCCWTGGHYYYVAGDSHDSHDEHDYHDGNWHLYWIPPWAAAPTAAEMTIAAAGHFDGHHNPMHWQTASKNCESVPTHYVCICLVAVAFVGTVIGFVAVAVSGDDAIVVVVVVGEDGAEWYAGCGDDVDYYDDG